MSATRRMGPSDRIDRYAAQHGWAPSLLPSPPPEMTPRQMRRFMHKLAAGKPRREDAPPCNPWVGGRPGNAAPMPAGEPASPERPQPAKSSRVGQTGEQRGGGMIRHIPAITAEQENFRLVPFYDIPGAKGFMTRRDAVEPVPVGTYVAKVFRVTGYDPDCDGSLMARLENVRADGEATGWEVTHLGLYPGSAWIVDDPGELDGLATQDGPGQEGQ